jgi:CHAT domain-containing protein
MSSSSTNSVIDSSLEQRNAMTKRLLRVATILLFAAAGVAFAQESIQDIVRSPGGDPSSLKISPRPVARLAAEQRIREVESLTSLTAEGRALYALDEHKRTGYEYCRLAMGLALNGEFRRAVREASKALYLGQSQGNEDLLAHAKRDLSIAYSYAGQIDRAELYASEALKHTVHLRNRNAVHTWAHKVLGDVALRRGDLARAISHYESSIRVSDGTMRFFARASLANAFVASNELAKAADAIKQAASYLEVLDSRTRGEAEAGLLRARGNLALKQGNPTEAHQLFSQGVERTSGAEQSYQRFWALEGHARAQLAQNDRAAALKSYLEAITESEHVRARFRSEEVSSGLFGEMQAPFDEAVGLHMDAGNFEAAWETSERGRARALLDLIRNRVKLASGSDVFTDPLARPAKLKDVQSALKSDEAVLQFHVSAARTYAWIIRGSSLSARTIDIPRHELARLVETFRDATSGEMPDAIQLGRKLHTALLRPLALTPGEALIVVPHDILHYAPFQAFHDGERFLIEASMLSYAPSSSALLALVGGDSLLARRLLALANPDIGPQFALPGAQREVEAIRTLFAENEVYFQKQATKQRFFGSIRNAGIIHLAAHAEVDPVDPLYSRIRLAPGDGNSGLLEAHEVYGIDLKGSRMVVLSTCESGLGKVSKGDEIWGFTRSFLSAGSAALLVSLWPVADESTARLMTSFYGQLGKQELRAALRSAQLALIHDKDYAHPFFWAPFNLIGNGR